MINHAVIFAPIGQASRTEQIVHRLSNAIVTGLLEANEQLPNEADLARMMGVSHITVRDALNTLRARNLIHTLRGRHGGSFVCDNIKNADHASSSLKSISTDYLSDLGDMHSAVLSYSARLASRRMTPTDHEKFHGFVMAHRLADTPELKIQADMRCLLALSANSQSARLVSQELVIQTEWASLISTLYKDQSIHSHSVNYYSQLADALITLSENEAARRASELIEFFTHELIECKLSFS